MSNLDIDAAISAHLAWADRLRHQIGGSDVTALPTEEISDDSKCQLGQWLFSAGMDYDILQEYSHLVEEHRKFHTIAAEVLRLHEVGETPQAHWVLENPFKHQSKIVVDLLESLKIDGF
jgi:methyl-accepting chemotaxis protein